MARERQVEMTHSTGDGTQQPKSLRLLHLGAFALFQLLFPGLLAFWSAFFFFSLRSSLFGLHFSQDLPALWAVTQHLFLHSLPSAAAFSQQVSFLAGLSAAKVAPPGRDDKHPRITMSLSSFIFFNSLPVQSRICPELAQITARDAI